MSNASVSASESDSSTSKVVALIALVLAGVLCFLLRDSAHAATAALVGVALAFGILIVDASRESSDVGNTDDGAGALLAAIERNRAEFSKEIAGLRKAVDACKADEVGVKESGAVRAEIAKLRAEVAKIV